MTQATRPDLTVCVFAWDEVETIESFVRELNDVLVKMDATWEILVIDDGSTDGTGEAAETLARTIPGVRVIHHDKNEGLGGVYRTGFFESLGNLVTFFPADAQFPPDIIPGFFRAIASCDFVLGYLPNRRGDVIGRALSGIERVLYRALLGKMPRFQGVFMVRRHVLNGVPLVSSGRGWAIVMELILRAYRAGYRMKSLPTGYRPRLRGHSKVNNLREIRANTRQLLALRKLVER